jgi:CheY-like chemotaxis protein
MNEFQPGEKLKSVEIAKHVLVVDDDESIRSLLAELLEDSGYSVSVASNGQEALDFLSQTEIVPDVILLDIMMPIKDAYEFRAEQISRALNPEIPFIVMSADGTLSSKKEPQGARAYFRKPLDIYDFLAAIQSCCA